jgi:hypothetical protein
VPQKQFDQNFSGITGRADNAYFHDSERVICIRLDDRVKSQTEPNENRPHVSVRAVVLAAHRALQPA